jgi:hypothetical protein
MANETLRNAKAGKNDEFYTQFHDIEIEINAYIDYNPDVFRGKTILLPCDDPEWSNFTKFFAAKFDEFGLKKLISTSYAPESKKMIFGGMFSEFEKQSPQFDEDKSRTHGKIFILEKDHTGDGHINLDDLEWDYLDGDGDFRSDEVKRYRDEADIIITNPPFSLFREFFSWIIQSGKKFLIISNKNCITYKELFPYIMQNKIWCGKTPMGADLLFDIPKELEDIFLATEKVGSKYKIINGKVLGRSPSVWFTNLDHGRRHEPLALMTMADNLRFSKHKEIKANGYPKYDNYDAIEVPFSDAIPADYDGVMGVPISWLDKYCPEQFEIVGITSGRDEYIARPTKKYINPKQINKDGSWSNGSKANTRSTLLLSEIPNDIYYTADNASGPLQILYARILIRKKS